MSCCGCASRVLKLQSEIRSWKTKLADEKREKKMILRWIMAVFGYDVRVDIDKETRGIRLQATENKEAVSKALIKLGLGGANEGDLGMMVMELKLEDHEFYEPFEEPHDIPEFPILEINSMSTQAPLVNTGISALGHISQQHTVPTLSITTPMEVTSTPLPVNSGTDQDIVYIAGNFEEGATLEGLNGQSYIIVRANENEDMPMQLDFGVNNDVVGEGNNLFFQSANLSGQETPNAINYLSTTPKSTPIDQLNLPTVVTPAPVPFTGRSTGIVPETVIEELQNSVFKSSSPAKSPTKKKPSLSSTKQASQAKLSSKKQKSGETNIKIKNVVSKAQPGISTKQSLNTSSKSPNSYHHQQSEPQLELGNIVGNTELVAQLPLPPAPVKKTYDFGLTLREKAELYVLQKANDAVERMSNGFRCTLCLENRYVYSNLETAMAHAKTHYESKPYKCDTCNELFAIQKELLKHRHTVHPKLKGAGAASLFSTRLTQVAAQQQLQLQLQQQQQQQQQQCKPKTVSRKSRKKSTKNNSNSKTSTMTETTQNISGNNCGSIINSSTNVSNTTTTTISSHSSSSYPQQQAKTVVVQAPFDNNLVNGPIRISSEVLAALLGGSNVVAEALANAAAATTTYNNTNNNTESLSSFVPISTIPPPPAMVLTTQGETLNTKPQNTIDFNLLNSMLGSMSPVSLF